MAYRRAVKPCVDSQDKSHALPQDTILSDPCDLRSLLQSLRPQEPIRSNAEPRHELHTSSIYQEEGVSYTHKHRDDLKHQFAFEPSMTYHDCGSRSVSLRYLDVTEDVLRPAGINFSVKVNRMHMTTQSDHQITLRVSEGQIELGVPRETNTS